MKYLLDTCVISELSKSKPNPDVANWIQIHHELDFSLSVLTIGEIQKGITKLPESKKKMELNSWFENELSQRFENRILAIDVPIIKVWDEIQGIAESKGQKMPVADSIIVATALAFGLTVVTRNAADMKANGVAITNPWEKES